MLATLLHLLLETLTPSQGLPLHLWLVAHYQIFLLLPVILALKAEDEYWLSRVSITANTTGMFAAIAPYWNSTRLIVIGGYSIFHIYLLVGLIFGAYSFLSYLIDSENPSEYYQIAWLLYNSAIAGMVIFLAAVSL